MGTAHRAPQCAYAPRYGVWVTSGEHRTRFRVRVAASFSLTHAWAPLSPRAVAGQTQGESVQRSCITQPCKRLGSAAPLLLYDKCRVRVCNAVACISLTFTQRAQMQMQMHPSARPALGHHWLPRRSTTAQRQVVQRSFTLQTGKGLGPTRRTSIFHTMQKEDGFLEDRVQEAARSQSFEPVPGASAAWQSYQDAPLGT